MEQAVAHRMLCRKRDAFFAALFLLHLVVVVGISLFASKDRCRQGK